MLPKANIRIKAVASRVIFVFFSFCEMYRTPIESVNPFIINNRSSRNGEESKCREVQLNRCRFHKKLRKDHSLHDLKNCREQLKSK